MGGIQEWDITVPEDGERFLAELRERGVHPGQRITVRVSEDVPPAAGEPSLPKVLGIFDGPADLASRSSEILEAEFPGDW